MSPGTYEPFPANDISCSFMHGNVSCQRLNGYQILLTMNDFASELDGTISQL
jgi:hypothetical protein